MTTKFSFRSKLLVVCIFPFLIALVVCSLIFLGVIQRQSSSTGLLPIFFVSIFFLVWIVFGEFKNKLTSLTIKDDVIVIKKFGSLFGSKYEVNEIDGFKKSISRSHNGIEFLSLIREGRKIGTVSEFHHKNYWEIKESLATKIQDLGFDS